MKTKVSKSATIGSGAKIIGGVVIGQAAIIGMGAIVTKDILANQVWVGNPARYLRDRKINE